MSFVPRWRNLGLDIYLFSISIKAYPYEAPMSIEDIAGDSGDAG